MRPFTPRPMWAALEVAVAIAIMALGLAGYIAFSSTPWLLLAGAIFLAWRGPGWRALGLRRPEHPSRVVMLGIAVGIAYQFAGLYVIEPALARLTQSGLPDVSAFRSLVGDESRLAFWLALSWTMAAFMEELVFRGWLLSRLAEIAGFSRGAWLGGAVVSSALFGAVHLYQGVSGVLATALTGAGLCALYLLTGRNLWGCILAHGTLDTAGFVLIYRGIYPGL
jgi:membrane protease YdiL (CAAX protease family)